MDMCYDTHVKCFFKAVVIIGSNKVVYTFRLIATKKFNVPLNHMRGRDNLLLAHRSEVCAWQTLLAEDLKT